MDAQADLDCCCLHMHDDTLLQKQLGTFDGPNMLKVPYQDPQNIANKK